MSKRTHIVIASVLLIGLGIGLSINVSAEGLIPSWIKNTAGFWVDNQISDSEFIAALQFLVKEGILVIPQSDIVSESISKVTTTQDIIAEKYRPNLEAFYVQTGSFGGDQLQALISVTDSAGKFVSVNGELTIFLTNFDDREIFNRKKYVVPDSFSEITNDVSGKTVIGFNWGINFGKVAQPLSVESLYNEGLGTMILTFTDSTQSYENEIQLSHLPMNEGFGLADTGFIDNFEVNKVLDVGPFFVTVKNVGRYIGEDATKGDKLPQGKSRYAKGQKRCNSCDVYIEWDGLFCPCCGSRLRVAPRHRKWKQKVLNFSRI